VREKGLLAWSVGSVAYLYGPVPFMRDVVAGC
jgi:hypothetical protein